MFSNFPPRLFLASLVACAALSSTFHVLAFTSVRKRGGRSCLRMNLGEENAATIEIPPNVVCNDNLARENNYPVILLSPNEKAADPDFMVTEPVGENDFIVSREGGPLAEELTNENLVKIVYRRSNVTDIEVNTLAWKCLGYRFEDGEWNAREVFPKWKENFPSPPDLVGMQRKYSKEVDGIPLKNNQKLCRSIPAEHKQQLRPLLKPYGFLGYKLSELTPNLTRRAQVTNWLLFYREELFGYSLEELKAKRKKKQEAEAKPKSEDGSEEEWKAPVREVF